MNNFIEGEEMVYSCFVVFLWITSLCLQVFLCEGEGCTDNETNILHYYHIALAFLTGFLFATHLPERLAPGSFDYIGKTDVMCLSTVQTRIDTESPLGSAVSIYSAGCCYWADSMT